MVQAMRQADASRASSCLPRNTALSTVHSKKKKNDFCPLDRPHLPLSFPPSPPLSPPPHPLLSFQPKTRIARDGQLQGTRALRQHGRLRGRARRARRRHQPRRRKRAKIWRQNRSPPALPCLNCLALSATCAGLAARRAMGKSGGGMGAGATLRWRPRAGDGDEERGPFVCGEETPFFFSLFLFAFSVSFVAVRSATRTQGSAWRRAQAQAGLSPGPLPTSPGERCASHRLLIPPFLHRVTRRRSPRATAASSTSSSTEQR